MASYEDRVKSQKRSVRVRTAGRLAKKDARHIWRTLALTRAQALARMPGWSQITAYRHFGHRNGAR